MINFQRTSSAFLALAFAGVCSAGNIVITNSDFSAVPVSCGTGYAYQTLGSGGDCSGPDAPQQDFNSSAGIGWTFAGAGLTGPSTAFNPPDFTGQAAFLQGNQSSIWQSLGGFLDSEIYTASFYIGSRYNSTYDGNQTVTVLIDDVVVGQDTLTSYSPFSVFTTDPFSASTGSHTLTLKGSSEGDHTAFVSEASVWGTPTATPEPATFGMIGVGLIGLYGCARRKLLN